MKKRFGQATIRVLILSLLWPNIVFAHPAGFEGESTARPAAIPQVQRAPVQDDAAPAPGVQVIESTAHSVLIDVITPDYAASEIPFENGRCTLLAVPDYSGAHRPGWPDLPTTGTIIGIPQHAEPVLTIVDTDVTTLPGTFDLCPVPQPIYEISPGGDVTAGGEAMIREAAGYGLTDFYPEHIAEIVETGSIRHQRVAQLNFHPFRYNPTTGVLQHYRRIRVQVRFEGDGGSMAPSGTAQPAIIPREAAFTPLLEQVVANYDVAQHWQVAQSPRLDGPERQSNAPTASVSGYKLMVDEDGIYRVTYAELEAAGIPVATLDPRTLALHTQGTEVALYVPGEADGTFDPDDTIVFYGQKMETMVTDTNVYWLTWGGANGLRMAEVDGAPTGSGTVPQSFRTTQIVERNNYRQSSLPSGADMDRWYWDYIWATSPATNSYTTTLTALATGPVSATIRGLFRGYSAAPQHHTQVYLNGQLVDDATWPSQNEYAFAVDVPQSYLIDGVNTITVYAPLDNGITSDNFLINRFEITYDRVYSSDEDTLRFSDDTPGSVDYAMTGFSTGDVSIFDVTTPSAPARLRNVAVESSGDAYTVTFGKNGGGERHYIALTSMRFETVRDSAASQPADLRAPSNGADYIIITHRDFYTYTLPLAEYRASQGLRTRVVDVQDIYDTFNYGVFDPEAIRSFLIYAYNNWTRPAPSYVVLVGDGHYDFKNYLGYGETNYIPPYLADVDPWAGEVAADNRYVCVSGDDNFPDMHLGRLPVKTGAEAQAVVTKIINYEQNPASGNWNQQTLFVADNPDSAGYFYTYSDAVADHLVPSPYTVQKIYYGNTHTSVPLAKSDIISAFNDGQVIVNYVGHGSVYSWAVERLLDRTDAGTLSNAGKLPFIVSMACLNGNYIFPSPPGGDYSSFSEKFVLAEDKGAIALWSATGLGLASAHDYLNKGLFEAVFLDDVSQLGLATWQAKMYLYTQTGGGYSDQIDTYLLFGDPALQLNVLASDLSLTQAVNTSRLPEPGDTITYTLRYTNTDLATAHRVVISDTLSAALSDPVFSSSGTNIAQRPGSAIVWDVADLPAGQGGTITLSARLDPSFSGPLANVVSISTSTREADTANNAPDPLATLLHIYNGAPTSVELVSFAATPGGSTTVLTWETASELNVLGFNLYRAPEHDPNRIKLNTTVIPVQVPGSSQGATYTYTDDDAVPDTTYLYWLESITTDGISTLYDPISVTVSSEQPGAYQIFLPFVVQADAHTK